MIAPAAIIRACYSAYEAKDRAAIESLLADDFTFSSPIDDNISRERYFERCWPNSEHIESFKIEKMFIQGDEAFVEYELKAKDKPPFRNTEFFTLRDGKITHVDVYFGADSAESASEEEIRSIIDDRADAIRRKDADRVIMHYAPEAVRYSLAPPLRSEGSLKDELTAWFATFEGEINCEMRDLTVQSTGEIAHCFGLAHMTGAKTDGEKVDVWFRETLCLKSMDGRWKITHDHESVPFYMDGSLKAAVDLEPA